MSSDKSLSQRLHHLLSRLNPPTVELRVLIETLGPDSNVLLLLLLVLPFLSPIPVPVLSAPFGLIVAWIGLRQALQQPLHLPAKLLATPISVVAMQKVIQTTTRLVEFLERHARHQLLGLCAPAPVRVFNWLLVSLAGLVLAIPAPIPFINGLPAWWVVLLSVGMLYQDGRYILAGYLFYVVGTAYLLLWLFLGAEVVVWLKHLF